MLRGLQRNAEEAVELDTPQFAASNRALELLGKHVGMFQEHSTVDHRHAHIVVTEHGVRDERFVGFSIEELRRLRDELRSKQSLSP